MKILGFIDKKNLIPWLDSIGKEYETFLPVQDTENARIDFMEYCLKSILGFLTIILGGLNALEIIPQKHYCSAGPDRSPAWCGDHSHGRRRWWKDQEKMLTDN